ncbi:FHA domain-containing protein [Nocardia aurea]|uniref:FHA domain-containing protein n=1 Tax=Nocardia aurea TaxID=2144174 RepID=A0ABV3FS44_9NOCA
MERMVILRPSELAGRILLLGSGRQLFGRDECADIRLEDQHLSAVHAAITNMDGRVTVEDLGSSNGTRVDGETIMGTRSLRDGDVITFGGVDALFEQTNDAGTRPTAPSTTALPIEANSLRQNDRAVPDRVTYDIDRQSGRHISNVGHDQYNSYVQQRESFLREVAASRTKARFIFWTGLVMTAVGALGYAFFLVKAIGEMDTASELGVEPPDFQLFGPDTGLGIPAGLIFFMFGFIGNIMLFVGIVMWIVAVARARKVDTDPRHAWNSPFVR